MAERTYVVTVASGNLYGGGTGNVYYLDGARNSTGPGTVEWVAGATLRFNQNDSSNNNHPLIFSSTTSQSDYLTSGVTYYLDGATTYSNYINTTNFNAATTRYVEVTPSSETDFYYLCYVHGIGMGGIFDITQSTWGALTWNQGAWSAQNDQPVSVTGVSLTSSIGTNTITANADVDVTGVSATINVLGENQITYSEKFDDSSWTKNLGTLTADATIAPNGTKTADELAETSGTGTHQVYETGGLSYTANQVVTWSVFLKNNDRRYAVVILANGSTNWLYGVIDLQTGTQTASGSGATGGLQAFEIEEYGNGWYRCSLRGFTQGSSNIFPKVILSDTGTPTITSYGNYSRTGDGSSSIFLWGAQLSDGFKQNYVPTFGTAVSSEASVVFGSTLTMTGQQITSQIGEEVIDLGVVVSGIQSTLSVGNAVGDGIIEVGWGGDTWGENEWGDLSGSNPVAVGSVATSSIGSVTTTADANVSATGIQITSSQGTSVGGTSVLQAVTGQQMTMSSESSVIDIGVIISGNSASTSIGAATVDESTLTGEGWGRGSWGEFAWGVNYSVLATGQSLTSSLGEETPFTDVTVSVTGSQITSTFGTFSTKVDQDLSITVSEHTMTMTAGAVTDFTADALVNLTGQSITSSVGVTVGGLKTPVDVTGISMTMTQGNISLVQTTNESVTGLQATMALGQHSEIPAQIITPTGQQLTSSVGSVQTEGIANVSVTGIGLTSSQGNINITAWAEIDPGVSNTWTDVDLAA